MSSLGDILTVLNNYLEADWGIFFSIQEKKKHPFRWRVSLDATPPYEGGSCCKIENVSSRVLLVSYLKRGSVITKEIRPKKKFSLPSDSKVLAFSVQFQKTDGLEDGAIATIKRRPPICRDGKTIFTKAHLLLFGANFLIDSEDAQELESHLEDLQKAVLKKKRRERSVAVTSSLSDEEAYLLIQNRVFSWVRRRKKKKSLSSSKPDSTAAQLQGKREEALYSPDSKKIILQESRPGSSWFLFQFGYECFHLRLQDGQDQVLEDLLLQSREYYEMHPDLTIPNLDAYFSSKEPVLVIRAVRKNLEGVFYSPDSKKIILQESKPGSSWFLFQFGYERFHLRLQDGQDQVLEDLLSLSRDYYVQHPDLKIPNLDEHFASKDPVLVMHTVRKNLADLYGFCREL